MRGGGGGGKVDVDGGSIVIISTSSQSRAGIAPVTGPIVNICIAIDEIPLSRFSRRVRAFSERRNDASETGRETLLRKA